MYTNALLTDLYQLTMMQGLYFEGKHNQACVFDRYYRHNPFNGGYTVVAGLEHLIDYVKNIHFSDDDLAYLKSTGIFKDTFLDYLKRFHFTGSIYAMPEGTVAFPQEVLLRVETTKDESLLLETCMSMIMNHESLIATKANRIVRAARGRAVMEFGTRRAHGSSAAILGARAAYIGGCAGTACTIADRDYGIPALGTMAHSWVQMFDTEYESFRRYAELYPDNCTLLVDTYNVLKSGVPNAIRVFKELDPPKKGIRIDSGDITYLTKKARKMLDEAGFPDCAIVVSNALDENLIDDIINQGACIDSFGVGERLITSKSEPVFGGVYKLSAVEKNGEVIPKIKISENVEKITNPGFKTVHRLYDRATKHAIADVITLDGEEIKDDEAYEIFDPKAVWKKKTVKNFYAKNLRVPVFKDGELVYQLPDIKDIRAYCQEQVGQLWEEMLRFENPQTYYVDLSRRLWTLKHELIESYSD